MLERMFLKWKNIIYHLSTLRITIILLMICNTTIITLVTTMCLIHTKNYTTQLQRAVLKMNTITAMKITIQNMF